MADVPSRLADPQPREPKCNCFRFLGKLHACKHHREPAKPPVMTMETMPDNGGRVWREMSAAVPYGETGPDWLESDKGWH